MSPKMYRSIACAGTILALSLAGMTHAAQRTTNDGVFTAEQAAKGAEVHADHCARCHHQTYYEGGFLDAWYGAPMSMLYEIIRMKMPEDRPGALKPREYTALLAWVLERNGYPAGSEPLGAAVTDLEAVTITRPE
jgi:S-disulfanyl-L-cysteine oxidoreductase SoxD